MTQEQDTYNVLSQQSFSIVLGGREIKLRPATLNDIQKMSAEASVIPSSEQSEEGGQQEIAQFVENGKYAKNIARIISFAAHPKSALPTRFLRNLHIGWQRRRIFRLAYSEADNVEIFLALQLVLKAAHPFFLQNIIISLKGMNSLKPTRETAQTALGQ
jgi:hypothetical protein